MWPTTPTRCPGISAAGRAARSGGDRMQLSCPRYASPLVMLTLMVVMASLGEGEAV
jgi:hypothetical protein